MGVFSKLPEGRGLFSKVAIDKGDIICDYGGDLLDKATGDVIASDESRSTYIFAFRNGMTDKEMYYDNYNHTSNIGRYINHSSKHPNSKGVVYYDKEDGNKPHILLVATRDIDALEQITFNYGKEFKCSDRCTLVEYPLPDWYAPFGSLSPSRWQGMGLSQSKAFQPFSVG